MIQKIKKTYLSKKTAIIYDLMFKKSLTVSAILMIVILILIFVTLLTSSIQSFRVFGFKFIFSSEWDPVDNIYGAFPFIIGTLITSVIAIVLSIPFALSIAIFLGEYYKKGIISSILRSMVELMAGIPSIIYGFWGLVFLVPLIRTLEMKIGVPPYGVGIISASIILTIMIIPYSASIAREVISMVPVNLKEAAFSLGCTRFEVVIKLIIPYAGVGIFAGILLAFGRAIGETMAVTMLIGNRNSIPTNIFSPANTMASIIANEFNEATELIHLSSLLEIGLILFVISTIINLSGKLIIKKMQLHSYAGK